MRKLLFLDFDGVLHRSNGSPFERVPLFEQYLAQMPTLEIVISSTWRESYPLAQLRDVFSPALRTRIIGSTPILPWSEEIGHRQREISAWLQAENLTPEHASWRALDDSAWYFQRGYPHLILVDAEHAFSATHGSALLHWYAHADELP